MFKKTAIAALVLGFSGAASAAMYAPAPAPACAAGNVTVPCERSAWDLGVDALYMRSVDHVLSVFQTNDVKRMDMGWGFRLEGSYHFGTGNDVNLNWTHFDKNTNNVFINANPQVNITNKLDLVNFEFGQQVDFGENVDMRFHAGVQWLSVNQDLSVDRIVGNGVATIGTSKASGFGPRVGAMVKYDFGNGFGVYVDSAVALLEAKLEASLTAAGSPTFSSHATALSTDSSVGVAYTHAMAQGDLTARLGWGVKQINVNQSINFHSAGWTGVNFGLKWVGNA